MLTLQALKKTQWRSIYSLTANLQGIINLRMDHRLRKWVRIQCMNRNIHWRRTMESLCWASYNGRGPLRKRFCHCLCEERKNHTNLNEESRELHLWIWFLRWGSSDDVSIHFSPSYLYHVWNTFKFYYWRNFLRRHSGRVCLKFFCGERRSLITHNLDSLKFDEKVMPWAKKGHAKSEW